MDGADRRCFGFSSGKPPMIARVRALSAHSTLYCVCITECRVSRRSFPRAGGNKSLRCLRLDAGEVTIPLKTKADKLTSNTLRMSFSIIRGPSWDVPSSGCEQRKDKLGAAHFSRIRLEVRFDERIVRSRVDEVRSCKSSPANLLVWAHPRYPGSRVSVGGT